jgi:hypothetical protein
MAKTAAMAMVIAAATQAARADGTAVGSWYVSPMVQWWQLDKSREAANHVAGQLALGYGLGRDWAFEVEGGGASFAASCGCALTIEKLSVDVMRKFMPDRAAHPYLIAGAGGIEDREDRHAKTTSPSVEGGGGMLLDLGSAAWQLRGEIKYQHEFHDLTASSRSVGDVVYGIGLKYSF